MALESGNDSEVRTNMLMANVVSRDKQIGLGTAPRHLRHCISHVLLGRSSGVDGPTVNRVCITGA